MLALVFNLLVFAAPKPAHALIPVTVTGDIPHETDKIINIIKTILKGVLMQAIFNMLNYVSQKLAYDAAVWVASGGKGQGSLFESRGWGQYMKDTALNGVAEGLGTLDESGLLGGFRLCDPSLPDVRPQFYANLQIGLIETYEPQPKCRWNEVTANWDELATTLTSGELLENYMAGLVPGEGGIESLMSFHITVSQQRRAAEQAAIQARVEGRGFKPVVGVSGNIESPVSLVESQIKQALLDKPQQTQQQQAQGLFSAKDEFITMGLNAASLFLNTLASTLFKRISTGLFESTTSETISLTRPEIDTGPSAGGKAAAQALFADLLTPRLIEGGKYNPLYDFASCPEERGLYNCVFDQGFLQAIEQSNAGEPLTVAQAIDQGFLHGDWPLVSERDPLNQEDNCYGKAYCYSNLVKLRKMRIIPIGWELAASSSPKEKPITLKEVVDNFNVCPDGVSSAWTTGQLAAKPYCHLIDPNWIIKMPQAECKMQAYSSRLAFAGGSEREKVCVDVASCVEEDSKGKCVGPYAYCTKDKHIWRITGETCPAEYSSCQTLNTRQNKKVSYLLNTVDYGECGAENVGCKWYASEGAVSGGKFSWSADKRVYVDKDVTSCPLNQAGCSELIRIKDGVSVNLLKNPSFEESPATKDWIVTGASPTVSSDGTNSLDGETAIKLSATATLGQPITVKESVYYTFSYYAKNETGASGTLRAIIVIDGVGGSFYLEKLRNIETNCVKERDSGGKATGRLILSSAPSDFYERTSCYFKTPMGARRINFTFGDASMWLDAVQFEEGKTASEFRTNSYPAAAELVYYKAAPDYLDCESDTPPEECKNYAPSCTADEVGCELYRSTSENFEVPAIIGNEDRCPAECNGYDVFRQEATNFESVKNSINLIPQSSLKCDSTAAGCDEFTETATEQIKYFSYLRPCIKPGDDSATYYTWEGSDTVGYQLKTWVLKKGVAQTGESGNPPAYISGFADYTQCTRDIFRSGLNPDCREIYDAEGNISYRLYSKTIVATNECKTYRKTFSTTDDCLSFGGKWRDNKCYYDGYEAESWGCDAKNSGCRAYTGATSRNIRTLFSDEFEDGTAGGWEIIDSGTELENSSESLYVGGHSLKGYSAAAGVVAHKNIAGQITKGKTYFLSFWAKASPIAFTNVVGIMIKSGAEYLPFGKIQLSADWQPYTVGPFLMTAEPAEEVYLEFVSNYSTIFFDNIALKEISEAIYLIKDSWTIPASCNMTAEGVLLPGAMLGCKEYKNTKGVLYYIKSFKNLCRASAVGCEEFIDTKLTDSLGTEIYNAVCERVTDSVVPSMVSSAEEARCGSAVEFQPPTLTEPGIWKIRNERCTIPKGEDKCYFNYSGDDLPGKHIASETIVVSADERKYLVANNENKCSEENKGCAAVAEPKNGICKLVYSGASGRQLKTIVSPPASWVECASDNGCWCYENESTTAASGEALCSVKKGERNCKFQTKSYFDKINNLEIEFENKSLIIKPADFSEILCKSGEDRCESWEKVDEQGRPSALYFKEPVGQICEYKDKVSVGGVEKSGWFKEGMDVPCYADYQRGEVYGIWKNGDTDYGGFTGKCLNQYSSCTTLEDPQTKEVYYFKRNNKLDTSSCNGLVSPKQGCVLLNDINDSRKLWTAELTNWKSELEKGALVKPLSCAGLKTYGDCASIFGDFKTLPCSTALASWGGWGALACRGIFGSPTTPICQSETGYNSASSTLFCKVSSNLGFENAPPYENSNLILKVQRDRVCDEWIDCKSTATVWDEGSGKYKSICLELGVCKEYQKVGDKYVCSDYRSADPGTEAERLLDQTKYQKRNTGFTAFDYTGYAVPGRIFSDSFTKLSLMSAAESVRTSSSGEVFGECRAYPEKDSPFPSTLASWDFAFDSVTQGKFSGKASGFENASICEKNLWYDINHNFQVDAGELRNLADSGDYEQNACECRYQKATYSGGEAKYFPLLAEGIPEGYCSGGSDTEGLPCNPNDKDACSSQDGTIKGTCNKLTKLGKYVGLEGDCWERDASLKKDGQTNAPCLTWLPLGVSQKSNIDIYNLYPEAGYNPPVDQGRFYCAEESKLWGSPNTWAGETTTDLLAALPVETYAFAGIPSDPASYVRQIANATDSGAGPDYQEMFIPVRYLFRDARLDPSGSTRPTSFENFPRALPEYALSAIAVQPVVQSWLAQMVKNNQNILSRKGTVGRFQSGTKWYTYWETRYPEEDIGNLDTGPQTLRSSAPLFTNTAYDFNFNRDRTTPYSMGGATACQPPNNDAYIAIRAIFDESRGYIFAGLWTSFCEASDKGAINAKVELRYVPQCTKLIEVKQPTLLGSDKAFTERVWSEGGLTGYDYTLYPLPFGGARHKSIVDPTSIENYPWYITNNYLSSDYFYFYNEIGKTNNETVLNRLFGKVYNVFNWDVATRKYVLDTTVVNKDLNTSGQPINWTASSAVLGLLAPTPKGPKIGGTKPANQPDLITINDKLGNRGDVEGRGGLLKVVMQFYGQAAANQMPLTEINIDWGDGSQNKLKGRYKNHSWDCSRDLLGEGVGNFGVSSEACEQAYFEFTHVYTCNAAILNGLLPCVADPTVTPACKRTIGTATACVYRPRVMIKDNWGWCNGLPTSSVSVYEARYGSGCVFNPFSVRNSGGQPYADEIIVYPQ